MTEDEFNLRLASMVIRGEVLMARIQDRLDAVGDVLAAAEKIGRDDFFDRREAQEAVWDELNDSTLPVPYIDLGDAS